MVLALRNEFARRRALELLGSWPVQRSLDTDIPWSYENKMLEQQQAAHCQSIGGLHQPNFDDDLE